MASVFSIVTIFAKQSGIFLPPLLLTYTLLFIKDHKKTFIEFITMFVTSIILLILFTNNSGLHNFTLNVVDGIRNGFDIGGFINIIMIGYLRIFPILFSIGIFLSLIFMANNNSKIISFLGFATITTFIFSTAISLKRGSVPSYFTEFLLLVFISIIVSFNNFIKLNKNNFHIKAMIFFIFSFMIIAQVIDPNRIVPIFKLAFEGEKGLVSKKYNQEKKISDYLNTKLNNDSKKFILITFWEKTFLTNLLFEHEILPNKDIVLTSAYQDSIYNYSDFNNTIKKGSVKYIISKKQKKLPRFMKINLNSYVWIKDMYDYSIFEYNDTLFTKNSNL